MGEALGVINSAFGIAQGVGSMIQGQESGAAARQYSRQQQQASNNSIATQLAMYNQNRIDQSPYRDMGYSSAMALTDMMNPTGKSNFSTGTMGGGKPTSFYMPTYNDSSTPLRFDEATQKVVGGVPEAMPGQNYAGPGIQSFQGQELSLKPGMVSWKDPLTGRMTYGMPNDYFAAIAGTTPTIEGATELSKMTPHDFMSIFNTPIDGKTKSWTPIEEQAVENAFFPSGRRQ